VTLRKITDGRSARSLALLVLRWSACLVEACGDRRAWLRRVGFDAFEVTHTPTRRALSQSRIAEVTLHYQPASAGEPPATTRPWLTRRGG